MFEKTISISDFSKMRRLNEFAKDKDFEISLVQSGQTVDAKDINQIFSLDLTKSVVLVAKTDGTALFTRELKQKGLF